MFLKKFIKKNMTMPKHREYPGANLLTLIPYDCQCLQTVKVATWCLTAGDCQKFPHQTLDCHNIVGHVAQIHCWLEPRTLLSYIETLHTDARILLVGHKQCYMCIIILICPSENNWANVLPPTFVVAHTSQFCHIILLLIFFSSPSLH